MGRKEGCPVCGSKKISVDHEGNKRCNVCRHEWRYSAGRRTEKKGRVRYR